MILRKYTPEDAEQVSSLIRTTLLTSNKADYSMSQMKPLAEYFSPEKIVELNERRVMIVAEEEDEIVGTIGLEANSVVTFFVHPKYQGKGIGKTLIARIEEEAKKKGWDSLKVAASLTAGNFYKNIGYKSKGLVEGRSGPQVFMKKEFIT